MGVPATTGQLRQSIYDMNIGDYIACKAEMVGNKVYLTELGRVSDPALISGSEITTDPVEITPVKQWFYFIKTKEGLLVADRVIKNKIDWTLLNAGKHVEGTSNVLQSTKILMHMDYPDFKDELGKKTIVINNGASLSTEIKKFGKGSIYFNGNGYLDCGTAGGYNLPAGTDWTIDCWYRPESKMRPVPRIWQLGTGWTSSVMALLDRHKDSPEVFSVLTYGNPALVGTTKVVDGTWYHIAVIKKGTTLSLFVNGKKESSIEQNITINSSSTLFLGGIALNGTESLSNGYIDEFRFVKGKAVWDEDFVVPESPYTGKEDGVPYHTIRSMKGGVAYLSEYGGKSLTDKNLGAWPEDNEWDANVANFPEYYIMPGSSVENIFNTASVKTWTQDTITIELGTSDRRVIRGGANEKELSHAAYGLSDLTTGYRPVIEYWE